MDETVTILFIADLHYSKKSILNKESYLNSFYQSILDKEKKSIDILVIAGDICDKGGNEHDYDKITNVIKQIMDKLNIKKIVVVPGNHDVSRAVLEGIKGDNGVDGDQLWKYSQKYKYFKKIERLTDIDVEKVIVSKALIKDKFLFLGIDSNQRIGIKDEVGFIDPEKLEQELIELDNSYKKDSLVKIVVMHHNPNIYDNQLEGIGENNYVDSGKIGNFDKKNWEKIKNIFIKHNIKIVLTGHVHGSKAQFVSDCEDGDAGIYYSSVGSIGVDFNNELLDILEKVDSRCLSQDDKEEKLSKLINDLQTDNVLLSVSNRHNTYGIITVNGNQLVEQHYKNLADEGENKWIPWYTTPKKHNFYKDKVTPFSSTTITESLNYSQKDTDEEIEERIMDIVRKEHLYKTGHFHRKDQCTMNWIDTSVLLTNVTYLKLITDYIVKKFNNIIDAAKCIVGLGMEGSILMTYIRYKYPEKLYSYYPSRNYNYNEFENIILEGQELENIVVLTDVIHTGSTLKTFAEENKDKIKDDNPVQAIAIFLTDRINDDSLTVPKNGDKNKNIEIRTQALLKVPIKPCGNNISSCEVLNSHLDVVYVM